MAAKHRGAATIEPCDINLILVKKYNIHVPTAGAGVPRLILHAEDLGTGTYSMKNGAGRESTGYSAHIQAAVQEKMKGAAPWHSQAPIPRVSPAAVSASMTTAAAAAAAAAAPPPAVAPAAPAAAGGGDAGVDAGDRASTAGEKFAAGTGAGAGAGGREGRSGRTTKRGRGEISGSGTGAEEKEKDTSMSPKRGGSRR